MVEVRQLWVAAFTFPTTTTLASPNRELSLDEMAQRSQALRAQQAQAVAKLKLAVEQRAVLAEQHPDCFTAKERLDAETDRRTVLGD